MPIEERSADECFDVFRSHVAQLVRKILPTQSPVRYDGRGARRVLTLVNDAHDDAVELATTHGSVFLHMAQTLRADQLAPRLFRLKTVEYRYKLYSHSPTLLDDAALRWEYLARSEHNKLWCRNHIQFGKQGAGAIEKTLAPGISHAHFPTGWVLMEEIFRFLIHELGMKPPCGDEWDGVLRDSERVFEHRFSRKSIHPE